MAKGAAATTAAAVTVHRARKKDPCRPDVGRRKLKRDRNFIIIDETQKQKYKQTHTSLVEDHLCRLFFSLVAFSWLALSFLNSSVRPPVFSSINGTIKGTMEEVIARELQMEPGIRLSNSAIHEGPSFGHKDGKAMETTCKVFTQKLQTDPEMNFSSVSGKLHQIECLEVAVPPSHRLSEADNNSSSTQGTTEQVLTKHSQVEMPDSPVLDGLGKEDDSPSGAILPFHKHIGNNQQGNKIGFVHEIHHRLDTGGGLYNFAADSKGAKILASNKEAKGASNVLNKDRDKYLRNPCSVENKFVDIELSEETVINSVALSNFEFYSSNLKEFELLGSSVYPPMEDAWFSMGKFQAGNIRALQMFTLTESKPVRYLKLRMVSHYGSEFYCTLSTVEVFGVDTIERMLEAWIAEETEIGAKRDLVPQDNDSLGAFESGINDAQKPQHEDIALKGGAKLGYLRDKELINKNILVPSFRSGGLDAAMKVLMQKVRSLEHSQPLVHRLLRQHNSRLMDVLTRLDKEFTTTSKNLGDAKMLISYLTIRLQQMEIRGQQDKDAIEANLLKKYHELSSEFDMLRFRMIKMENKATAIMVTTLICVVLIGIVHVLMQCLSLCGMCTF